MQVIRKLSVLLDETIGLVRDAREFITLRRLQGARQPVDFYGARGTEFRITPPLGGFAGQALEQQGLCQQKARR